MGFDLSNYETVEQRLVRFWAAYPNGRIETCMMNYDGDSCVFRAELYRHFDDAKPMSVGYAHEQRSERGVNMTSWCENGETSSIGRAISNSSIQSTIDHRVVKEPQCLACLLLHYILIWNILMDTIIAVRKFQ